MSFLNSGGGWLGSVLLIGLTSGGCEPLPEGESDSDSSIWVSTDDFEESVEKLGNPSEEPRDVVLEILERLFPNLTREELQEAAASLSLEDALALQAELEEARAEAAEASARMERDAEAAQAARLKQMEQVDGFLEGLAPHGLLCTASEGQAEVLLSGLFLGKERVDLEEAQITVSVDGVLQAGSLDCLRQDETVDIVFLIDITGSMRSVITSVRSSVVQMSQRLQELGLQGTMSVVTFQDSVGVNVSFQEVAPGSFFERSPFFEPVPISDAEQVDQLQGFVRSLEANKGGDGPENIAGAIDFARNNVIGGSENRPNVIDGDEDPPYTAPFPQLESDRQVFVVLTDAPFHSDSRDETNSSLLSDFVPRDAEVIARTLQQTSTVVHVVAPNPYGEPPTDADGPIWVDADYWARATGGLGVPTEAGYSIFDLNALVMGGSDGLFDIRLDDVLASSCRYRFEAEVDAEAEVEIHIEIDDEVFEGPVPLVHY